MAFWQYTYDIRCAWYLWISTLAEWREEAPRCVPERQCAKVTQGGAALWRHINSTGRNKAKPRPERSYPLFVYNKVPHTHTRNRLHWMLCKMNTYPQVFHSFLRQYFAGIVVALINSSSQRGIMQLNKRNRGCWPQTCSSIHSDLTLNVKHILSSLRMNLKIILARCVLFILVISQKPTRIFVSLK